MSADTKLGLLKEAVLKLKTAGVKELSVDALLDYVSKLEVIQERREPAAPELEHYKAQLAAWVEKQKEASAINVEGFKSVISSAQVALRSAILLNGGAAVALLAYVGRLSIEASSHVPEFAFPLLLFVTGALVVAVGSGVAYLSQWFYFGGGGSVRWRIGLLFNILGMLLTLLSYGLFAWGALLAYRAFKAYA